MLQPAIKYEGGNKPKRRVAKRSRAIADGPAAGVAIADGPVDDVPEDGPPLALEDGGDNEDGPSSGDDAPPSPGPALPPAPPSPRPALPPPLEPPPESGAEDEAGAAPPPPADGAEGAGAAAKGKFGGARVAHPKSHKWGAFHVTYRPETVSGAGRFHNPAWFATCPFRPHNVGKDRCTKTLSFRFGDDDQEEVAKWRIHQWCNNSILCATKKQHGDALPRVAELLDIVDIERGRLDILPVDFTPPPDGHPLQAAGSGSAAPAAGCRPVVYGGSSASGSGAAPAAAPPPAAAAPPAALAHNVY